MIIPSQGVARHVGAFRLLQYAVGGRSIGGEIVHARGDDAQCCGDQFFRAAALGAVVRHIGHLAVKSGAQPMAQTGFMFVQPGVGDTCLLKAQFARPGLDIPCQLRVVAGGLL